MKAEWLWQESLYNPERLKYLPSGPVQKKFVDIRYKSYNTGWGNSRFTVVCMEDNTVVNQ